MSTSGRHPRLSPLRGGLPADDDLDFAVGETPTPPAPRPEFPAETRPAAQAPPAPVAPMPAPRAWQGASRDEILDAVERRIARTKLTTYVPRELADRLYRLSRTAGHAIGRKRVPEYVLIIGALLSLPDPEDPAAVEEFLSRLARDMPRFPRE